MIVVPNVPYFGALKAPDLAWDFAKRGFVELLSSYKDKAFIGNGIYIMSPSIVSSFYSAPPLLTTEQCSFFLLLGINHFGLLSPGSNVQGKQ